jgi:hypothetical protein
VISSAGDILSCHIFISASLQVSGFIMTIRSSVELSRQGHGFNQNSSRVNYIMQLDGVSGIKIISLHVPNISASLNLQH